MLNNSNACPLRIRSKKTQEHNSLARIADTTYNIFVCQYFF